MEEGNTFKINTRVYSEEKVGGTMRIIIGDISESVFSLVKGR